MSQLGPPGRGGNEDVSLTESRLPLRHRSFLSRLASLYDDIIDRVILFKTQRSLLQIKSAIGNAGGGGHQMECYSYGYSSRVFDNFTRWYALH